MLPFTTFHVFNGFSFMDYTEKEAYFIGGNEPNDIDASNVKEWKETLTATLREKLNV